MKTFLLIAFLIIMAFILTHRYRFFVRDPLATVYQSALNQPAGAANKQHGVQVYINYSNDVLLIREDQPKPYNLLLQHWSMAPGAPVHLRCVHLMACLTDADQAQVITLSTPSGDHYDPHTKMTDRQVDFVLPDGTATRVDLR